MRRTLRDNPCRIDFDAGVDLDELTDCYDISEWHARKTLASGKERLAAGFYRSCGGLPLGHPANTPTSPSALSARVVGLVGTKAIHEEAQQYKG